jgi:hypothetical protein
MNKLQTAWKYGWPWGLLMFGLLEVIPMIRKMEFNPLLLVYGLVIWSLGALWIGYVIHRVLQKRGPDR